MKSVLILAACAVALPLARAWGVVGHEVVATVAQIHLHPTARQAVSDILPKSTRGHLAPVAAWADRVRYFYHWSGVLHYITPIGDHPSEVCDFEDGFADEEHNVVKAIGNYTDRLAHHGGDLDLRFLTHYVGDVHQPLHLTGRERGGNGDPCTFEGRHMSLHGLWDTQLISRALRELRNYTAPTTSRQIESNLRGTIYDPFLRWLVVEGLGRWWRDDVSSWLDCPDGGGKDADVMRVQIRRPSPSGSSPQQQQPLGPGREKDEILICPKHWASESHKITCSYPFPPGYDPHSSPPPELGGPEYYGRIRRDKIVESLLVKAGIRLAATLNAVFASDDELAGGALDLGWHRGEGGAAEAGKETGWTRAVASFRRGGSWIV